MEPTDTGRLYDAIADGWDRGQDALTAGLTFLRRAIGLVDQGRSALDVGCGTGGRMIDALEWAGFRVTGLDVSAGMLRLAARRHPGVSFAHADVCTWGPPELYDLVVAWDSVFHVPHDRQRLAVEKLCDALAPGGAVLFTAGGVDGEVAGEMWGHTFHYGSLEAGEYLRVLEGRGCKCILIERDQHPAEHLVVIGVKVRR